MTQNKKSLHHSLTKENKINHSYNDRKKENEDHPVDFQFKYIMDDHRWHFFHNDGKDIDKDFIECDSYSIKQHIATWIHCTFGGEDIPCDIGEGFHGKSMSWVQIEIPIDDDKYDLDDIYNTFDMACWDDDYALAVKFTDVHAAIDCSFGKRCYIFSAELYKRKDWND